ncbi:MAG: hypothetical protein KI790_06660, partial [Cyclobacteriaceae bacterium]|nr:hypothetical protein [Cyclobacteriaceae bacterium HetDA_MAG_MS6]
MDNSDIVSTKASYKTLQLLLCILWISACTPPSPKVPREDHDLLRTMEQYQRFSQKLWFASDAKNWKLADFYSHELEEVTEELVESKVNYEGHDISNLAEHIIRPNIEQLEKAI